MMSLYKFQLSIIFSIGIFFFSGNIKAQEKLEAEEKLSVYIGNGSPGVFLLGFRVLSDQHEIGGTFGILPDELRADVSMSVDYTYHFGGNSRHTNRKPWYFGARLNYTNHQVKMCTFKFFGEDVCITQITERIELNPKIGRDFNFSSNFGLQFDLGLSILLADRDFNLSGAKTDPIYTGDIYLSASLGLFYKI